MSEYNGVPAIEFPGIQVNRSVPRPIDATLSIEGMAADAKATGDALAALQTLLQGNIDMVAAALAAVRGILFPVGSIYISTSSSAPTFGGADWNWKEIMLPATWGDVLNGSRSYAEKTEEDTPGTVHFWLRIADTEGASE